MLEVRASEVLRRELRSALLRDGDFPHTTADRFDRILDRLVEHVERRVFADLAREADEALTEEVRSL